MSRQWGCFITGTDTDVGKTQVAYGLAAALARKPHFAPVHLWKPVQSGVTLGTAGADSYRLLRGSGIAHQQEQELVTYTFPDPLAPWIAASRCGETIDYERLLREGQERFAQNAFWIVEGAGGLGVPLTDQHMMVHLAADLGLPLLIIARAGLGTVNHTLQTIAYARWHGGEVCGVILNGCRPDGVHAAQENAMMIERFGNTKVLGILPWMPEQQQDAWYETWANCVETQVDVSLITRKSFE